MAGWGCAARPPQPAIVQGNLAAAPAAPPPPEVHPPPAPRVAFASDVQPILERCQPCHFPGGVMYGKLPFDQPKTVVDLGEKLFTRIKDEQDRAVIRTFLSESAETATP